jgi:hypothetical protein
MSEVPVDRDLAKLAPAFLVRVQHVVADLQASGFDPWVFEAVRTAERQAYLWKKGRDLPGSIVTKAKSHLQSWHGHGLAVDIISKSLLWNAPATFWTALGASCKVHGLTWGGVWLKMPDRPHCQWGECPASPTTEDKTRTASEGMEATWFVYHAVAI